MATIRIEIKGYGSKAGPAKIAVTDPAPACAYPNEILCALN
jgi:hypothetical protein